MGNPKHIDVKPVYTREDLEGLEHLDYAAGVPPYLRVLILRCMLF